MQDQNNVLYTRFSLLCAALSVLAVVLLFTMDFSWLIVLVCAAICIAGVLLALKSMMGERPRPLPLVGLVVCVIALIVLVVFVIFSINNTESMVPYIDQLKDSSTVIQ